MSPSSRDRTPVAARGRALVSAGAASAKLEPASAISPFPLRRSTAPTRLGAVRPPSRAKFCRRLVAAGLALASAPVPACSGDGGASGAGGNGSSSQGQGGIPAIDLPYDPCPEGEAVGEFVIGLDVGFTYIEGRVSDDVLALSEPSWAELARGGDCRLLRAVPVVCVPPCAADSEVCSPEAVCVALPRNHDVGIVTVHGLVIPMQMRPNPITRRYVNPAQPLLPHPGFTPGADVRISSAGGDYAPFELRGWGVSPLVLGSEPIEVAAGQPTRLTWQAPATPGPARVHAELNINLHGSTSAKIECDFADTGAAEIPASLIDGLIAEGLSGFPTLEAQRRSATSVQIEPGCVEMLVSSKVSVPVQVEGIVSCDDAIPCPAGQTCLSVELFCQ